MQEAIGRIPVWILASFFFLCQCASGRSVDVSSREYKYRGPIDPMSHLPLSSKDPLLPSFRQIYISWRVEHDNLASALDQGRLFMLESHRRVVGHLSAMDAFLSIEKKRVLKEYRRLYDHLLLEVESGSSSRVMRYKYNSIKNEIMAFLNS